MEGDELRQLLGIGDKQPSVDAVPLPATD
jgi:hypothetical protein